MQRRFPIVAVLLIAAAALAFRLPKLADRPLHNDEAVNTFKYKELHETGRFAYDPQEYHGPVLYYVTVPFVRLSGADSFADSTERPYRLVPLVFSIALILLTLALRKEIGPIGVTFAALYAAASPCLTFYSRYYIHEYLLVVFTFTAILGGWRYVTTRKLPWAIATGTSLGLMWATKETWIIPVAAAGGAVVLTWGWNRLRAIELRLPPGEGRDEGPQTDTIIAREQPGPAAKPTHLWVGLLATILTTFLTAALFFTNFFHRPRGIVDAIGAYQHYVSRGSGNSDHVHPFAWYLRRLTWFQQPVPPTWKINRNPIFSELAMVALAGIGVLIALIRRKSAGVSLPFARFLAFYTLLLTLAYSVLPYKTPWCALGFVHGMTLLAGFAVAQLVRLTPTVPGKVLVGLVVLLPVADLVRQSYAANNRFAADPRNPWVYAPTSGDIETLVRRMADVAKVSPAHEKVYIQVVTQDCWPIPWYLRAFPNVGYWPAPPDKLDGDVIIGPIEIAEKLPQNPNELPTYMASSFGLRPGYVLWIYIKRPLWEQLQTYWATQTRANPPQPRVGGKR
jgi:uncharacterized protein (TIGR03663 family)